MQQEFCLLAEEEGNWHLRRMHVNTRFSDMYKVQRVQRSKPCRSQEARRELETLRPTELPDEGLIDEQLSGFVR
jgi:hypothetical protein